MCVYWRVGLTGTHTHTHLDVLPPIGVYKINHKTLHPCQRILVKLQVDTSTWHMSTDAAGTGMSAPLVLVTSFASSDG